MRLAYRLAGPTVIVGAGATRELLFFALSIASSSLLNLGDTIGRKQSQAWSFGGLVITILATLYYGEFVTGEVLHAAMHVRFAYNASLRLAVAAFIYSAIITGLMHSRS